MENLDLENLVGMREIIAGRVRLRDFDEKVESVEITRLLLALHTLASIDIHKTIKEIEELYASRCRDII